MAPAHRHRQTDTHTQTHRHTHAYTEAAATYLCLEAVLCHVSQAGLILLQECFTPALQMLTGEGGGLQDERHTACTRPDFEQQRNSQCAAVTGMMPSAAEAQHWKLIGLTNGCGERYVSRITF